MRIIDVVQGKAPLAAKRSNNWYKARKAYLSKHPFCESCGGKDKLEVHHIVPFHEAPELELEESNLIVLCESKKYGINCHLAVGHLGDYRRINDGVKRDATYLLQRFKEAHNGR